MQEKSIFRTFMIAFLLIVPLASVSAQQSESAGDYVVSRDTPHWFKASFLDFEEDIVEAVATNKRLMIYFGQDGCPYCKQLHDTSFKDDAMVSFINQHFDAIAVNILGDVETVWLDGVVRSEKALSAQLGIQFTPTLLFLNETGDVIVRIDGYRPLTWMRVAFQFVADKADLQGISFENYMQKNVPDQPITSTTLSDSFQSPTGNLHNPEQPVLVFVSQDHCPMCNEWRTYLRKNTEKWRTAFRITELNRFGKKPADNQHNESEWASSKKITFAPALIFIDERGQEFFRAESYLRALHLDAVLEYAKAGATTANPEFQRFLQEYTDQLRQSGQSVRIW